MQRIDALILAGDNEGYYPVTNKNKALITINNRKSIEYILDELEKSSLVKGVYIIGPPKEHFSNNWSSYQKKITFFQQKKSIMENILFSYKQINCKGEDIPILIIPADVPLITSTEVDFFIANSNFLKYDYVMGFVDESALTHFYPSEINPGIRLSYYYFKQFTVRPSNLHIANPFAATNSEYVDKIYALRYQKNIMNYLKFLKELLKSSANKRAFIKLSFLMQLSLQADRFGLYKLAHCIGKNVDVTDFEKCISDALQIRFKTFCLNFGASAIDIDNEKDLLVIKKFFNAWREYLLEQARIKSKDTIENFLKL